MQYGFTNDLAQLEAVRKFRDAAIADGWQAKPTYPDHEDIGRASSLSRDGWTMSIMSRENIGKWKGKAEITIWAPDGLQIEPPATYDWATIQDRLNVCLACKKRVQTTYRLPALKKEHEYPGWTN